MARPAAYERDVEAASPTRRDGQSYRGAVERDGGEDGNGKTYRCDHQSSLGYDGVPTRYVQGAIASCLPCLS